MDIITSLDCHKNKTMYYTPEGNWSYFICDSLLFDDDTPMPLVCFGINVKRQTIPTECFPEPIEDELPDWIAIKEIEPHKK